MLPNVSAPSASPCPLSRASGSSRSCSAKGPAVPRSPLGRRSPSRHRSLAAPAHLCTKRDCPRNCPSRTGSSSGCRPRSGRPGRSARRSSGVRFWAARPGDVGLARAVRVRTRRPSRRPSRPHTPTRPRPRRRRGQPVPRPAGRAAGSGRRSASKARDRADVARRRRPHCAASLARRVLCSGSSASSWFRALRLRASASRSHERDGCSPSSSGHAPSGFRVRGRHTHFRPRRPPQSPVSGRARAIPETGSSNAFFAASLNRSTRPSFPHPDRPTGGRCRPPRPHPARLPISLRCLPAFSESTVRPFAVNFSRCAAFQRASATT